METDSIDCLDGLDAAIYYAKELVNIKYGFRERNQADDGAPDFAKNGPPPQRGRITKNIKCGAHQSHFSEGWGAVARNREARYRHSKFVYWCL